MLHRPADSRLLANLLSHERDHLKLLGAEIDAAQVSLQSFSAYASASPPPASQAIVAVAGTLVGANEAMRGYLFAVEEWCGQLRALKEMEDEVGNVVRDREILVDRLIKASKSSQKPSRRSVISASGSQTSSHFASSSNVGLEQIAFSNSKLNVAQNELQACETHLAERERALAQMRENAIVKGLKGRCKAMVECGWKWGEMGKEGLRALEGLNFGTQNGNAVHSDNPFRKPLPDPQSAYSRPSSDLSSSIGPSQSASQIVSFTDETSDWNHSQSHNSGFGTSRAAGDNMRDDSQDYVLSIPPAHAIPEQLLPPSRQQTIEEEEGGSSAEDEEDEAILEVHDNKPFSTESSLTGRSMVTISPKKVNDATKSKKTTPLPPSSSAPIPSQSSRIDIYGNASNESDSPIRDRKKSSFFGTITSLFHHKRGRTSSVSSAPSMTAVTPSKHRKGSPWMTRTDRHLKNGGGKGDESSDEERDRLPSITSIDYDALRRKSEVEHKVLPSPSSSDAAPADKARALAPKKKLRKASDAQRRHTADVSSSGQTQTTKSDILSRSPSKKTLTDRGRDDEVTKPIGVLKPSPQKSDTTSTASPSLSRSSTVRSQSTTASGRRHASLDAGPSRSPSRRLGTRSDVSHGHATNGSSHLTRNANVLANTSGQPSLMSIIEDVTRQNRRGWNKTNPNNLLFDVKAPPTSVLVEHVVSSPVSPTDAATTHASDAALHRLTLLPGSVSEPNLPLGRTGRSTSPLLTAPTRPLRSALRNPSPSPSPSPAPPPAPPLLFTRTVSPEKFDASLLNTPSPTPRPRPEGEIRPDLASHRESFASDTSISSYATATGLEEFEDAVDEFHATPSRTVNDSETGSLSTPLQETKKLPTLHNIDDRPNGLVAVRDNGDGTQLSHSSDSTSTAAPHRRKSVRMSLNPTFSPTPPALYDDEVVHAPWDSESRSGVTNGWPPRADVHDAWEDSSDEDAEYARARALLSKTSLKRDKKKP